jgi:hypothetical protein
MIGARVYCPCDAQVRHNRTDRTGPDILSGEEIARIYTKHLGREIRYSGNDLDAWGEKVKNMIPEYMIPEMRIMYQFFQDNGMIATKDELEKMQKLLGKKPRIFDEFVKEITVEWRSKVMKAA